MTTSSSDLKATIFQDANYAGNSQALGIGRYNLTDLTIGNVQLNLPKVPFLGEVISLKVPSLSSLKVPSGLRVTLYQHSNFQGETRTYTSDVAFTDD